MKRVLSSVLVIIMLFSLSACGGGQDSATGQSGQQIPQTTETPSGTEATPNSEPESSEVTPSSPAVLPIELKEFGYSVNNGYLYYSIHLYNPNEQFIIEYPSFRVSARDASGVLLGTEDQTIMAIYPQHDAWHAFLAFEVEDQPESVDVEILPTEEYNIIKASTAEHPEFKALTVVNTAMRGNKLVGEIQNENDYDISSAVVTVVFRDENGKLIGGTSTFVDAIPASGSAPFDETLYEDFVTDTYEVYADNWG